MMRITNLHMTLRGNKTIVESFTVVGPIGLEAPEEALENKEDTFGNMAVAGEVARAQLATAIASALAAIGVDVVYEA